MCSPPNGRVVWFLSTSPWFFTWPQREELTCPSSPSYSEGSMTFEASSQPREHSEWELISRKKEKKREKKERGSRLGIKYICLAAGACLVTYTYALFPSVSVFRVSSYMAPHYGLIWGSQALANNRHGAWPVRMPSKYFKGQARQCFSPDDLAWEVTYCQFSVTPIRGMSKSHCKKSSLAAEAVEAALKIHSSALVHEALCSAVPIASSPSIWSGW